MATIEVSVTRTPSEISDLALWKRLTNGDDGSPLENAQLSDRTVMVQGSFNGETVTMQGSMDGIVWTELHDHNGSVLSFTTTGMYRIMQNPKYIRPLVSGATGNANIDVYVHALKV